MPLITFIIPLYNKSTYIINTIESIVYACSHHLKISEYEIIIVDDGSTDDSCLLVEDYILTSKSQIQLVRQKNAGPSVARNHGLSLANGKYISCIDADDLVLPIHVEYIKYADVTYSDANVFTTSYQKISSGNESKLIIETLEPTKIELIENFFHRWSYDKFCYTSSIIMKREFLLKHDIQFPIGHHSGEDQYVWFTIATLTQFIHLNQFGISYLQNVDGQLSSKRPLDIEIHVEKLAALESEAVSKKDRVYLSELLNSEYFYIIVNNLLANKKAYAIKLLISRPSLILKPSRILKVLVAFVAPGFYNMARNKKDTFN